jgi:phenylacetate-coenzyme A ligase PaaK-like adenylate-forming protein
MLEIINPESGNPVEDGQSGEVVFTTLTRKAMPLIRYRTGDIASFSSVPCACGTFLKTMNRVQGRVNNKICIAENKFVSLTELDELILSFQGVLDYKAYLAKENCFTIELAAQNEEAYESIKDAVFDRVKDYILDKCSDTIGLQIVVKQNNGLDKITNSMVKRKIYDLRMPEL